MSKHFAQALTLTRSAGEMLVEIEGLYAADLGKMELSDELLVKIKMFLEALRSVLEYCAQGLAEKYGTEQDKSKIAFPYAKLSVTKDSFMQRKYIDKRIPGLTISRPDIEKYIMAMQHFSDPRCMWFPQFMELTNKSKHVELTPHKKFEGVQAVSGGLTIVAKGVGGNVKGAVSAWDAFLLDGVEWPMTAIEFLRHCSGAISSVATQLSRM